MEKHKNKLKYMTKPVTCSPEKVPVPTPCWLTLETGYVEGAEPLVLSELELDEAGHSGGTGTDHANSRNRHFLVFKQ